MMTFKRKAIAAAIVALTTVAVGLAPTVTAADKPMVKKASTAKQAIPPLGPLPPAPIPTDNPMSPEKVELGKLLFWDSRMGGDASSPCVVCHDPKMGWGDGGEISRGYPGTQHWRNSQTVLNSAYYNKIFWEGSVTSLKPGALRRRECRRQRRSSLMEMRLRFIPNTWRFKKARRGMAAVPRYQAIAAFERTLVSDAKQVPRPLCHGRQNTERVPEARHGCLTAGRLHQCHGPLAAKFSLGVRRTRCSRPIRSSRSPTLGALPKGVTEGHRNADRTRALHHQNWISAFRTLRERRHRAVHAQRHLHTLDEVVDFCNRAAARPAGRTRRRS